MELLNKQLQEDLAISKNEVHNKNQFLRQFQADQESKNNSHFRENIDLVDQLQEQLKKQTLKYRQQEVQLEEKKQENEHLLNKLEDLKTEVQFLRSDND